MKSLKWFFIVIAAAAVILFVNPFVVTNADEYTLVKQFGQVVAVYDTPGLNLRIPFIQTKQSIPKYKMIYDIEPSDVITKDKKIMTVDSFAIWEISDPVKYLSTLNASEQNAQVRIGNAIYNATKTVISMTDQDDIISGRDGALAAAITEYAFENQEQYGINIIAVETKKLDLPDTNKQAVYQRMISERENIATQYTAEGEYQYNLIVNETDRTVRETVAKANAEAEKIKADGEVQYMQILSEAYNDESKADFYNFVRSLDAVKESLKGDNKTLVLDSSSELAQILSGK